MSEFDLIQRFFCRPHHEKTLLGIGDDAALTSLSPNHVLATSSDMLVAGVHFFENVSPLALGHKALAVNLSDMAAMGATPRWATLSLALPEINEPWLLHFCRGFFALAEQFGVDLIGGDTTKGPLNISITIMGELPAQQALKRSGAQAGDEIWVSGYLGEAALGLAHLQKKVELSKDEFELCHDALLYPMPRIALGLALRNLAHSAIDLSDGLLADLGHILTASKLGAELQWDAITLSDGTRTYANTELGKQCILAGGDDYELCFTAAPEQHKHIQQLSTELNIPLSCIGQVTTGQGCSVLDEHGKTLTLSLCGYDHFK